MGKTRIMVKGIVKKDDKYLLVKRWYDDRIGEPYQWEFIDGIAEFGEAPEAAVARLVQEAVGISAGVYRILYTWNFMVGDVWTLGISYELMASEEEITLSEELCDFAWVEKEEFEQYIENEKILEDINRCEL